MARGTNTWHEHERLIIKTRLIKLLPAKVELTKDWPRIYRKPDPNARPGFNLPPDCQTYYLCIKPYGGDNKIGMDGSVVMFSLNGGLTACIFTFVKNIERDVEEGKLEQVPNGLRMLIELE